MAVILTVCLILFSGRSTTAANTNVLIVPAGDTRPGAAFFMDECFTRGLTNSISIGDLRTWAANLMQRYQQRPPHATNINPYYPSHFIATEDIPEVIRTIQDRIPSCRMPPSEVVEKSLAEAMSKMWNISKQEADEQMRTIGPFKEPPEVDFWRSADGKIEAVAIAWYDYGVAVGPESFKDDSVNDLWYHRKLADGIFLWHGYH